MRILSEVGHAAIALLDCGGLGDLIKVSHAELPVRVRRLALVSVRQCLELVVRQPAGRVAARRRASVTATARWTIKQSGRSRLYCRAVL